MFLSSLRNCGFLAHLFPAINHWAIIVSPYGTRLSINISGLSEKAPLYKDDNIMGKETAFTKLTLSIIASEADVEEVFFRDYVFLHIL